MKKKYPIMTILSILASPALAEQFKDVELVEKNRITFPRFATDEEGRDIDLLNGYIDNVENLIVDTDSDLDRNIYDEDVEVNLVEFDSDTITVPLDMFSSESYNDRGGMLE